MQRDRATEREAEDIRERRKERVNLGQTALIGSILATLAAIQAFGYKVSFVPGAIVPSVIVTIGAVALWAVAQVLRTTGDTTDRSTWASWLITSAEGALSASATWLALSLTFHAVAGASIPPAVTLSAMIPAFVLGWLLGRRR